MRESLRRFISESWPFRDPERGRRLRAGESTRSPSEQAAFETLALELHAWQIARNPHYAAFSAGISPRCASEIPAIPVDLFRDLDLCCFPPANAQRCFLTSGTTQGKRGAHRLLDTELYDLGSEAWFRTFVPSPPARCLALLSSPDQVPESSLSHMVGLFYPQASFFCDAGGRLDRERAWDALRRTTEPLFVAATGFALAELLSGRERATLPEGSLLMVTGGFKGRHVRVDEGQLLSKAFEGLGPELSVLGEYGMTELSSQLWTLPFKGSLPQGGLLYLPPPWMTVIAVDPGTGRVLPPGKRGQLRFIDLANDQSVLAIETMDQGIVYENGGTRLLGRLPSAPPRGCSLSIEEAGRVG